MIEETRPFVKWAGGKYNLSEVIINESSDLINFDNFNTYIDPFVGGGGMFFSIIKKFSFDRLIISDINEELINVYIQIRDNLNELVSFLNKIQNEYNYFISMDEKKDYYYQLRTKFNENISKGNLNAFHASLFIALNKLDFNGLYRVNLKGLFNVPFGKRITANLYDIENLKSVSSVLKRTEIYVQDYKKCIDLVDEKSLVYFDSPYRPLPGSSSFTSYTKSDFNDDDQKELAVIANRVRLKGGTFILSNSDPKQTNKKDNFFDELYDDCIIKRISASRNIGANSKSRGNVSEILVIGKGD